MLAGSVGKTFVSAVVLALVQEELLTLDTKIATWLGDEKWFGRLPNGRDITLRMLLTHTSGIPEHHVTDGFLELIQRLLDPDNLNPDTAISPEQMVAHILDREPLFPAGSDFEYADTNYILVGMIIEKVSGRTYYDELQRRFLAPLDLTLTSPSDRQRLPGVVPGYLAEENFFGLPSKTMTDGALVMNPALEWTGGGLASNPRDLVRWARVLYEGEALPEPYLDELLAGGPPHEFRGEAVRYGLGVTIRETDLGMTYGHSGWFPGYSTVVRYYAKYRLTVAIQINTDHDSGCYEAVPRLARVVLDNTIK